MGVGAISNEVSQCVLDGKCTLCAQASYDLIGRAFSMRPNKKTELGSALELARMLKRHHNAKCDAHREQMPEARTHRFERRLEVFQISLQSLHLLGMSRALLLESLLGHVLRGSQLLPQGVDLLLQRLHLNKMTCSIREYATNACTSPLGPNQSN